MSPINDEVPFHPSRLSDLVDNLSEKNKNLSSLSLSEKLPGETYSRNDRHIRLNTEEVKKFGEELKAGVSTISNFWQEFKDYIENGDIIDDSLSMAAGQSFSDIMNSFVMDLVVPIFSTLLGRPNASNFFLILKSGKDVNAKYNTIKEAELNGASILPYGKFLQVSSTRGECI
ncbi:hypothetical protein DSO57_1009867 [Entomophthora muscae]|uniref:Uncharacterized protein n=2 Tax=Entomophthora muscae TaxID=34485 RepID=A0ACC2SJG5_9FUNG|nr:hypothetical protein DSO57_1009867 [Entomophthora muscae]